MSRFLIHRPGDAVGVATEDLTAGAALTGHLRDLDDVVELTAADDIPLGHKVALTALATGDEVVEYGVTIGVATADISPGQHVHVHNLKGRRWA